MKCNACGTEMTVGGKFCPACGAAVAPDPPPYASKSTSSVMSGLIGAVIAAVVLGGGGGYYYYVQQQEKARVEAERVAEEKHKANIAERDNKLAEERIAREREANARKGAENQARLLAQQKAEAEARARLAEEQARKANAAAAAKAIPPAPPPAPPRQAAGLTTERSAPLIRAMVSAGIASDEGGIQRYRRDIEALPRPAAGNRAASTSARQAAEAALKRDDTKHALAQYQYAISIDAADMASYSGLGLVYSRLGRYADAEEAFSRALTLAPAHPSVWANYAVAMARGGNANSAVGALINSYVFATDRRRSYESLQRLANNPDRNLSAAATRALQSRVVADTRSR